MATPAGQRVRHYVPVMLKALFLILLSATMYSLAIATPRLLQKSKLSTKESSFLPPQTPAEKDSTVARSERSTNLSHITGAARKIQMFIKNRHLQLLHDGTVNGTTDDTSTYSESTIKILTKMHLHNICLLFIYLLILKPLGISFHLVQLRSQQSILIVEKM